MFNPWRVQIIVGVSLCAEPSEMLKTKPRVRTATLWGEKSCDWWGPGALEGPVVFSGGHKSRRPGGLKHRNLLSHSSGGGESEIEASAGLSSSEEAPLAIDGTPLLQSPLSLSACLPACLLPPGAAAKSLPSCPTLCDPLDGSPPGSPSLGCSRQEHWRGLPFPSPGGLTHCWQRDPALQSRWGAHRGGGREGAECSEEKQFGRMGYSEEETETAMPQRPVTAHRSLGCSETSRYPGYASEPLNQNVWGSDLSTSDLQIFPADSHCVVQDEILKSWSHVLDSSSMQDKLSILTYSR